MGPVCQGDGGLNPLAVEIASEDVASDDNSALAAVPHSFRASWFGFRPLSPLCIQLLQAGKTQRAG